MADDFPDLHHKMSKKIAQLTRVIFYLNSKNDENDYNMKNVIKCYEQEIDNVVQQANDIVKKYKDSADKSNVIDEIEKNYQKFLQKVESERASSVTEFQTFKKRMEDREKDLQNTSEKKL